MRIEYDPDRDLLYIWFGVVGAKAARTLTVAPGVHADFDAHGKLVGLEVLDATEILGKSVQFEVTLPSVAAAKASESG
ncbi:MAG TPA: DUF2283 domain-containing protein [Candidatus Acetothermia bacterium]|nr:DUF2283 domain-containing protein [Candidatus Acetothermia bacterium]